MSPKQITKVIYKPDSQSTDEYIIMVNRPEYLKWKDGDTSIPLTEVVDSFDVFHSGQGNQGLLGKASKQTLENVFGTSKDVDVVHAVLSKGKVQSGDGIAEQTYATNPSRGSAGLDSYGNRG